TVIDIERLIAQTCSPDNQRRSQFVIIGRGGIPASPVTPVESNQPLVDLGRTEKSTPSTPSLPKETIQPEVNNSSALVEAQGWRINQQGQVVLTATAQPQNMALPQFYRIPCPPKGE
ncbi:MAG: hypothetical protein SWJ54_09775, partial [Cyanobacteriota bacterium]|nr:hypothetical protein [Cyanobacteriota bacterium]